MDKHALAVTLISVLIFLIMIPLAVMTGITGFIPDLILFIVLTLFYFWMYDTFKMNVPILTLLIFGHILHSLGIFGFYGTSPVPIQWDHITHFFGNFPFALLFFNFLRQFFDVRIFTKKNFLIVLTIFLAATGTGALVEMSEFIGYMTLGHGDGAFQFGAGDGFHSDELIQEVGGGWINTGWDFIYNTLGVLTGMAIMFIVLALKKKPKPAYYFQPVGKYSRRI